MISLPGLSQLLHCCMNHHVAIYEVETLQKAPQYENPFTPGTTLDTTRFLHLTSSKF